MFNPRQSVFRRESLERLSSPERLDQLMQVVAPQAWLGLAALTGLCTLGIGWSIWGKLPLTVTGRGILVRPYQVVEVQLAAAGKLQSLRVKVGDRVELGEVLGVIDQADLQQQLRLQQAKLVELQGQDRQLLGLTDQGLTAELQTLRQQRQVLQQRLRDARELEGLRYTQTLKKLQQQRRTVEQQLQNAQALLPQLQDRLLNRKQLQIEGAIASDAVLQAETDLRQNTSQIFTLQTQLRELDEQETAASQVYRNSQTQTATWRAELQALLSREKVLLQQGLETTTTRQNQLQEVRRTIVQLTQQLQTQGRILSPYAGRVLEVTAIPGQVVSQGTRLVAIETGDGSGQLVSVLYFPIKDGKQIKPGMVAQITPDTVKREQYGGIWGRIRSLSAFPVTRQSMALTVGNGEVAQALGFPGGQLEAVAELQTDAQSGAYRWSASRGPEQPITAGTTVSVQVTIGEQAPISFVLPMLRSRQRH